MSMNDNYCSNKFLQGVLSQPTLNEKSTRGFASRNINDKDLFNDIIQSTTETKPMTCGTSKITKKNEGSSKVDKIIEDFLNKVKKRNQDSRISSIAIKPNEPDIEIPNFHQQKRIKHEVGPLRYFKTASHDMARQVNSNIFTQVNTSPIDHCQPNKQFVYKDNDTDDDIRIPKLSFFLRKPGNSNFGRANYFNKESVDLDESTESIGGGNRPCQTQVSKFDKFQCQLPKNKVDRASFGQMCPSSSRNTDQHFNFDCDFISPINYSQSESQKPAKGLYPPNAFSTPKYKDCKLHPLDLVKQNKPSFYSSVGSQTNCNHICLMCSSSSNKNHYIKHDYFYEE